MNLRIFDVLVEGSLVLNDFDIFRDAPGKNIPEVTTSNVFVTDGTITIDFVNVTGDPSINGIEIIYTGGGVVPSAPAVIAPTKTPTKVPTKVPSTSPTKVPSIAPDTAPVAAPTPTSDVVVSRINCGSTTSVTMNNVTWSPDQYFASGRTYVAGICTNATAANSIYCSSRYFQISRGTPFRYNIPVPYNNTSYQVLLHFAEQVRGCLQFRY